MSTGRMKLLSLGAIGSVFAASICCVGPIVLALMGLGGGALMLKFAPYRPYFLGATTVFLGTAFYLTYRRSPADECEPGGVCASPSDKKREKVALWIVAIVVALAAVLPSVMDALF